MRAGGCLRSRGRVPLPNVVSHHIGGVLEGSTGKMNARAAGDEHVPFFIFDNAQSQINANTVKSY